ncbi:MAG: hypothetical protein JWN70_822 [Planctomycetaceae bacterium]|nr:hypothetical protein [Planctomycetaceae bacterium]
MNSLLDPPPVRTQKEPAQRLRTTMAAMRLSFTWFGIRKALSSEQKASAADAFGAEADCLSAGKKLIDTRDPTFRAVTSIRSQAVNYFKGLSLPFPEPGLRLIRQADLDAINDKMGQFKGELRDAVATLDAHFGDLKAAARQRLGRLYNSADYPDSLTGLFELAWDFPSVEPPEYLRRLSPELYRQEAERVTARFDEAVQLAEQAFVEELSRLVSHLSERLSGAEDGKPKVFRDSVVENLTEFFQRFRMLNVRSNEQLDELVSNAQQIVRGVNPQQLRDSQPLRQQVVSQLSGVEAVLDGLLVDRPRRAILRRPR